MISCRCGVATPPGKFGAHAKGCQSYKDERQKLENIDNEYIVGLYKSTYSVSECCNILQDKFLLGHAVIRKIVTAILKERNVFEGITGEHMQSAKQAKMKKTMLFRYGVINAGQMDGNGFKQQNKIPYTSPVFFEKYNKFRKLVDYQTRKTVSKLAKPVYCEYTGVMFADNQQLDVNPNDPCKRTVDHIQSVYECFFKGWTVEQTSGIDNLIFCLRLCNTIKGNNEVNHFRLNIANNIREGFINEGYKYKEDFKIRTT